MPKKDKQAALMRKALAGDTDARNEIVMSFRAFLVGMAIPFAMRNRIDQEDLVNQAIVKILKEFNTFRPELGIKPMSYFAQIAYNEMVAYADRDCVVSLSSTWRYAEQTAKLGKRARRTQSLEDARTSPSYESSQADIGISSRGHIEDYREPPPEHGASAAEAKQIVAACLKFLATIDERMQRIIEMRQRGLKLSEVAEVMGLDTQRVHQLEAAAHKHMKSLITSGRWREYDGSDLG